MYFIYYHYKDLYCLLHSYLTPSYFLAHIDLHWLPLHYCSSHKICTLMYKIFSSKSFFYLSYLYYFLKVQAYDPLPSFNSLLSLLLTSMQNLLFPSLVLLSETLYLFQFFESTTNIQIKSLLRVYFIIKCDKK